MNRFFGVLTLFFLSFLPAAAQDITIEHFCREMPHHVPADDVNYKPGVDFKGRKVAPADLNRVLNSLVDPIEIPIEVDLIRWLNIQTPPGVQLEPDVAHIDVYKDGRIEYNGQDISGRVSYICNEDAQPQPVTAQGSAEGDGQAPADGLVSGDTPPPEQEPAGGIIEGEAQ